MLKKLLLVITFVAVSFTASAQYLSGAYGAEPVKGNSMRIRYAVKTGMNLTTMSGAKGQTDFSVAPGFQIGAACNLRWDYRAKYSRPGTGLIGLQPELLYSYQSVGLSGNDNVRMNRLVMPLMVRCYPGYGIYVEAGPEFSYLFPTSPDSVELGVITYEIGKCSGLATDMAFGAGWESGMGLTAGVRYGMGLTSLARNLPWKTHNFALFVGWMF